jgi:hypothetical protein
VVLQTFKMAMAQEVTELPLVGSSLFRFWPLKEKNI